MKLNTSIRKKFRVTNKLKKVARAGRFRLSIFRSTKNISAQIIDDTKNITLLSASSVDKDIKFAGQVLKSGNYSMYVVPFQNYWQITLNSKINSSGYERPDPINDILTVSIPLKLSSTPKEQLTISLKKNGSNATMTIEWENVFVVVPIEIL